MSILDNLDSGDLLSALLGVNTQTAVQTNGGEGSPLSADDLPQQPPQTGPGYTINTAGRRPGVQAQSAPANAPQTAGTPMPPLDYMAGAGIEGGYAADPRLQSPATPSAQPAPAAPAAPAPAPQVAMPMPTPDPRSNPTGTPTLAGVDDPNMVKNPQGQSTTLSARSSQPGTPVSTGIPVAPAAPQNDPLHAQLSGIQPVAPDKWGQFAAGVGKGLSAVGSAPRGATAGQMFAAGAGGGLSGAYAAGQKENEEFFKNTISADNQVMKGKKFPHDIAHEDASTNYLTSGVQKNLANAALGPMGKVYGSWLQSDVGRLKLADTAFDNQEKRNVQYLQEKNKAGIDVTKDWQKMEEGRDARKAAVYKQYGITDPTNYKGSQKNPIDASTMTPKQIEQAPEGTYFKYTGKDGKTVIAPRDYNAHPNRAALPAQGGGMSDYAAEQAALAGGGAQ